ncbi:MAG: J domain-containing protein [Candidatus Kapaibacterium sp.]
MKIIDYYKVLGVKRTASSEDIKRSYYKLSRKYHPDFNIGDDISLRKFLLVKEAYETLGDIGNRVNYKIRLELFENEEESKQVIG